MSGFSKEEIRAYGKGYEDGYHQHDFVPAQFLSGSEQYAYGLGYELAESEQMTVFTHIHQEKVMTVVDENE